MRRIVFSDLCCINGLTHPDLFSTEPKRIGLTYFATPKFEQHKEKIVRDVMTKAMFQTMSRTNSIGLPQVIATYGVIMMTPLCT